MLWFWHSYKQSSSFESVTVVLQDYGITCWNRLSEREDSTCDSSEGRNTAALPDNSVSVDSLLQFSASAVPLAALGR